MPLTPCARRANLRAQFLRYALRKKATRAQIPQSRRCSQVVLYLRSRQAVVSSIPSAEPRPSDGALIERVVARDESALAELYDRYSGMVSAVAMRVLRDAGAAEEVLQDIFYQLWRNAAQFDPRRGSLAGWLLVSARNRSISRLRRKNPGEPAGEAEDLLVKIAFPFHLETDVTQQQLLSKVKGAMRSLPQAQREAVELAYFEGLTHSEIAERTGEPLGTVKTRLRSALESLKRAFNP